MSYQMHQPAQAEVLEKFLLKIPLETIHAIDTITSIENNLDVKSVIPHEAVNPLNRDQMIGYLGKAGLCAYKDNYLTQSVDDGSDLNFSGHPLPYRPQFLDRVRQEDLLLDRNLVREWKEVALQEAKEPSVLFLNFTLPIKASDVGLACITKGIWAYLDDPLHQLKRRRYDTILSGTVLHAKSTKKRSTRGWVRQNQNDASCAPLLALIKGQSDNV